MREFACKDVGFDSCDWKTTGANDDEVLRKAGEHGREAHGITEFTSDLKNKVLSKIHDLKEGLQQKKTA